jgi:predicted nucleotidyltransferase
MEQTTVTEAQQAVLLRCSAAIKAIEPGAEVILYGSRARGDAAHDSDYDLLVLTDGEVSLDREDRLRQALFPVELETGCVLTIMAVSRGDWNSPLYEAMPFCRNVKQEGLLVRPKRRARLLRTVSTALVKLFPKQDSSLNRGTPIPSSIASTMPVSVPCRLFCSPRTFRRQSTAGGVRFFTKIS